MVIQELCDQRSGLLPARLAHFYPQLDFVDLDGKRVVSNIFTVSPVPELIDMLSKRFGKVMDSSRHSNRNVIFRFPRLERLG